MSDKNTTPDPNKQPTVADQILERAINDEQFREQLVNDFDNATKDYDITPADVEALQSAWEEFESGQIEVLDGRDNPAACCCCCPCCCSWSS